MDVHLRRLRYFQVVAQELHVTRAAQRLHIAQPSLSKQISELEAELGADLFIREAKTIRLTPAGVALQASVGAVLSAWRETQTAVADAAAAGHTTLRVGFVASAANEMTRDIIAVFAQLRPGWRVAMTQTPWSDPTAGLASGAVDAALLRMPLPGYEHLIVSRPLLTEPRWPPHPLAHRDRIAFSELLEEPFIATPTDSGGWRDYWLGATHRDGRPATIGAEVNGPDEWLEAIANGQGISLTPEATARYYARPGLTYLPVDGVDPSIIAICWAPTKTEPSFKTSYVAAYEARTSPPPPSKHRRSNPDQDPFTPTPLCARQKLPAINPQR